MKKFLAVLVLALCSILPLSAQRYTNQQQNFAITLPGPAHEDTSNTPVFIVSGYDPQSYVGAMVIVSNNKVKVPTSQDEWNNLRDNTTPSNVTFKECRYPTWNGDSTIVCTFSAVNDRGVRLSGFYWADVHNGYLYVIMAESSDGSGNDDVPSKILNSFQFLK